MRANRQDYDGLFSIWTKVFPQVKGMQRKRDIDTFWNLNKHDVSLIKAKVDELDGKYNRQKISIKNYFVNSTSNRPATATSTNESDTMESTVESDVYVEEVEKSSAASKSTGQNTTEQSGSRRRTAQEEAELMINTTNSKIVSLTTIKDTGLATPGQLQELKSLKNVSKQQQGRLKKLKSAAERQIKFRHARKIKMAELMATMPTSNPGLPGTRGTPGRPRLEESQPGLLETIISIVTPNAAADIGRRSELVRSCLTLDDLHKRLKSEGYELSRTATYLRLLPKNMNTIQGRRHHKALPVKLIRARNDGRSSHVDSHFSAASIKFLKDLAEIMGPSATFVISQDDKARVPLGIPAATKEAPILMHLEYRVQLPDHDFPLGSRHKLIPSVYAGLVFDEKGRNLTYSGPTYVAIRSGKHDKSSPASHAVDLRRIFKMPLFNSITHSSDGNPKPIVVVFTDGGPDENPRFQNVINEAVNHFKEFNLDGLFIATHAPGQSAMNQVERRMAPLSHDLSGLILPHDYYGSHLEGTRTIDETLEVRNFQRAGEALADVWSKTVINGHDVQAEYIPPLKTTEKSNCASEDWCARHIRTSQYVLQIVKCGDVNCCGMRRTSLHEVLGGLLPGPLPFLHTESGIDSVQTQTESCFYGSLSYRLAFRVFEQRVCDFLPVPYDWSCPSLLEDIKDRVCSVCKIYFCSKKSMGSHKKALHTCSIESIEETIESVVQQCYEQESEDIPVINNMLEWLQSPFMSCNAED